MASSSRTPLQPLTSEQQETVIKQRMTVEERPLPRLVKKLTLLLASRDPEVISASRLSFKASLDAFQLQLARLSSIARHTSEVEVQSYTTELAEIEDEQQRTQERIHALKRRLEDVRRERKNKLEYDLVAGEIVKLPTRTELEESLSRLGEQLESVKEEREKYRELRTNGDGRVGTVIGMLEELRNDVGYEVGERERREVERTDADVEANEGDADEPGSKPSKAASDPEEGEEEEEAGARSRGSSPRRPIVELNPSAPTFRPAAPESSTSARRKRDSTAVTEDEEGEVETASNNNTPRKRQRTEEGEVASEEEEEEGSIRPATVERVTRVRAGIKRQR